MKNGFIIVVSIFFGYFLIVFSASFFTVTSFSPNYTMGYVFLLSGIGSIFFGIRLHYNNRRLHVKKDTPDKFMSHLRVVYRIYLLIVVIIGLILFTLVFLGLPVDEFMGSLEKYRR